MYITMRQKVAMRFLNRVNSNFFQPISNFARENFNREFAVNVVAFAIVGIVCSSTGLPVAEAGRAGRAGRVIYNGVVATTDALKLGTAVVMSQTAANAIIGGVEHVFRQRGRQRNME